MRFDYKNKTYELAELKEPNKNETFDIIAVFRVKYCLWTGDEFKECSKEEFESSSEGLEKYGFIGYFYGADASDEALTRTAKEYIDMKGEQDQ